MLAVELVQIGRQEPAGDGVAGADDQRAQQQLLSLGQLVLASGDKAQSAADVLIQHLPLAGQGHAPGAAGEQPGLQRTFQLLDGLAHRRLGDIQIFGRGGDVAGFGHLLKYAVQFKLYCHKRPPAIRNSYSCHTYYKQRTAETQRFPDNFGKFFAKKALFGILLL